MAVKLRIINHLFAQEIDVHPVFLMNLLQSTPTTYNDFEAITGEVVILKDGQIDEPKSNTRLNNVKKS